MSDRLTEIRARLDAATPGPWYADWPIRIVCADGSCERAGASVVEFGDEPQQDDTAFIEHAPADIAWLLDEVERLRSDNAENRRTIADEIKRANGFLDDVEQLRKRLAMYEQVKS